MNSNDRREELHQRVDHLDAAQLQAALEYVRQAVIQASAAKRPGSAGASQEEAARAADLDSSISERVKARAFAGAVPQGAEAAATEDEFSHDFNVLLELQYLKEGAERAGVPAIEFVASFLRDARGWGSEPLWYYTPMLDAAAKVIEEHLEQARGMKE